MSRAPRDAGQREIAATEFTRNLVVSAGAGTGKTSLLVERILIAVGSGRVRLDQIAAVTFTEKAAGELRHRLAAGLASLRGPMAAPPAPDEPGEAVRARRHLDSRPGFDPAVLSARADDALARLDAAAVSTIHGFCAELLRSYPVEAAIPPGFRVEPGPVEEQLRDEVWAAFAAEELGPAASRPAIWERALSILTMSQLARLGKDLSRGAFSSSLLSTRPGAMIDRLRDRAAAVARDIRSASLVTGVGEAARDWFRRAGRVCEALETGGPDAARGILRMDDALAKETVNLKTVGVPPGDRRRLARIVRDAKALLRNLPNLDDAAADAVLEAVLPYAHRTRREFARAGFVDFDTLLVGARDLLRDHPLVCDALKRRFRMLLLDEFQDTDPVQYEIVMWLAEALGEHAANAWRTRLEPGRLFIVGDAKQSIYRFRGADYAAYRRAIDHVVEQGGQEVSLTSNFRSVPETLEPINALFAAPPRGCWEESPYLSRYEPVAAEKESCRRAAVEIWTTPSSGDDAESRRRAEGDALASEIAAIVRSGALRYQDVMVLFRSMTNIGIYLRPLREAGIPFVVSGGREFAERSEIVHAIALLRAINDPDDPIARLAVLRSPVGGVPDDEIERFAARSGAWGPEAASDPASCPRVAAALARLAELRARVLCLPVDLRIRAIVEQSGLLALSALGFDGPQRVANLEKLAWDGAAFARDGRLSFEETIDALESRPRGEDEGDSPLSDEATDSVRLMTIHKAKGLEAPLVIVADTAAGQAGGNDPDYDYASVARIEESEAIAVRTPGVVSSVEVLRTLDDHRHEEAENVRLLYVALTRAADRLVLLAGSGPGSGWSEALAAWGFDSKELQADGATFDGGRVLHRLIEKDAVRGGAAAAVPAGRPGAVAAYEAALARASAAAWTFRAPSLEDERSEDAEPARDGSIAPALARAVGVVVHRRLERFDGDTAALVAGLEASAADPAERNGVGAAEVAAEARAVLAAFAASPLAARLTGLDVLGREVPMLFREDDARAWSGTIDLIYREPGGTIVVADYKTDAALDLALDRHREQLRIYVEAVRRAVPGASVRGELWMVRHGEIL